jgi:hypothetical protein
MANAPQPNDPNFTHDMKPHLESWDAFNGLAKWTGGATIVILIAMYVFLVPHG